MELSAQNKELTELLNDLVKINYSRIAEYNAAQKQLKDNKDLKVIFRERCRQSQNFISELNELISKLGEENKELTTDPAKISKNRLTAKNNFNPDNASIIDSCEFGEKAAVKTYEKVLKSTVGFLEEVREKIMEQLNEIRTSHNFIKKFRDFNLDLTA